MKKYVLKKWVKKLLYATTIIALIISATEFENTTLFIITHIIAGLVLIINFIILWTQTNIFEEV